MHSSFMPLGHHGTPEDLSSPVLVQFLGSPPEELVFLGGGGNSRVYRVKTPRGETLALKAYFRDTQDSRDRLGVEFGALGFLWKAGVQSIPRPLRADFQAGLGLMEYLEGVRIYTPTLEDVDSICRFLIQIHNLTCHPGADELPPASEAHFSLASITDHVQGRLDLLRGVQPQILKSSGLGRFLEKDLLPAWEVLQEEARRMWDFERELKPQERTLSPSDVGFHNVLRREGGDLAFLDFEYFGWDDPAKLLVDFLLHPGMELGVGLRERYAQNLLGGFALPGLGRRARLAYPLFGIKWCAILLNEFLPSHLTRRRFAATGPLNTAERQAIQLEKCRRKLQQVLDEHAHFTCFDASF